MESIKLEEKYILEYIRTTINELRITPITNIDFKYHHNTQYMYAPMILRHGILSLLEQNKNKVREYSEGLLEKMSDTESHINGNDSISLSVVGLKDLDPKKEIYNPYKETEIDFLISNIVARRNSKHYDNEFLCEKKIEVDKIRGVDIRLLKFIEKIENKNTNYNIQKLLNRYNYLKLIALAIKESKLDIPFRDMSYNNVTMDIDRLSTIPELKLK